MKKLSFPLSLGLALLVGNLSGEARWSPFFPIANETARLEMAISVASNGTHYLVPVMSRGNNTWSLYGQFIDNNGIREARVTIMDNINATTLPDGRVAFGEGKYLVIWKVDGPQFTTVKGRFVYPNGNMGNIFDIVTGIPVDKSTVPDIAYGAGKFLVIYEKSLFYNYESHQAVYGKFINATSGVMSQEFRISSLWGGLDLNQIAFDGTNFLVVYRDDRDDRRVLARFVSPATGGPVGNEIVIDANNLPSDNPLAVFFDGQKYLIVWTDQTQNFPNVWQFYGKFLYPNGTQSAMFNVTHVNSWKVAPFVSFDGTKFLISWTDGRNCGFLPETESLTCVKTASDIYGRYFSINGTPLGGEFTIITTSGNDVGGFMGRTQGGKSFGIINRNFQFIPDAPPLAQDVDGRFWIPSGYDIFAPENLEKLLANSTYTIRWNALATAKKFNIYFSDDNGATWQPLTTGHTLKTYNWNIPPQSKRKGLCKIKIEALDASNNTLATFESRPFSIEVGRILAPNGGELLISNQTYTIRWQTRGLLTPVSTVQLQYSFNGTTWFNIKTINGNPGQTTWRVPKVTQTQPTTRIRIIFRDNAGNILNTMDSEGVFTIIP